MVNLTDAELCMLEQLTYLDEDVAAVAGVNAYFGKINEKMVNKTINEILSDFDDKALLRLATHTESVCDAEISGFEWVQIISYLKNNPKLANLRLAALYTKQEDNYYRAAVYVDGKYIGIADKDVFAIDPATMEYITVADYKRIYNQRVVSIDEMYMVHPDTGNMITYTEYASNYSLPILGGVEVQRIPLGLCFVDFNDPTSAIIAYKGTTGQDEWGDNAEAAVEYATTPQHEALKFAEQMVALGYEHLTVTGHSKGANHAMFTTIMCDNVEHCVCFDGEGFSFDFISAFGKERTDERGSGMEKPDSEYYVTNSSQTADRIAERAELIYNYSLSTDFVHILLHQLPGSNQIYVEGYGVGNLPENHAPNSFFVQNNTDNISDLLIGEANFLDQLYNDIDMTQDMVNDDIFINKLMEHIGSTGHTVITEENIWDVLFSELFFYGLELDQVIYERLNVNNRNYISRLVTYISSTLTLNDGQPILNEINESPDVATLHDLTVYILSLGDEGRDLFLYVADVLSKIVLSQSDSGNYVYDKDLLGIVMADPDKLAKLLGHVVLFINENQLDGDYVEHLLADWSVSLLGAKIDSGVLGLFLGGAIDAISDAVINHLDDDENILLHIVADLQARITINASILNLILPVITPIGYTYAEIKAAIWAYYNQDIIQQIATLCENSARYCDYYKTSGYDHYVTNDYRPSENFHMWGMTLAEFMEKMRSVTTEDEREAMTQLIVNSGFGSSLNLKGSNVLSSADYGSLINGGDNKDAIYGSDVADALYGGNGKDTIHGKGGDDFIVGDMGYSDKGDDDILLGGDGNDIILGNGGNDLIEGGSGNDIIWGDDGKDTIKGGNGADIIHGGNDNDTIYGENGNDVIFGESGDDKIYAGAGQDRIHGGDDDDVIRGGDDKDWIYGDKGGDILYGDGGDDVIDGGIGNDTIYGNDGNDTLKGSEGNDTLNGGTGDDTLRGGDQSDTYHFYKHCGNDTIYDQYGSNIIEFNGIELADLTINYIGTYQQNLTFTITSTNDTLTIIDYMHTDENFKYKFGADPDYYTIEDNDGVLSFSKIEGSHIGGRYDSHWDKQHDDTGSGNSDKFSAATAAQPPRDPLVIDLGTPGIDLTTIDDGVYFDLDKNGFAEKTAWIGTEDGFLVLDRNGNGIIDDGGELFSDQVEMSDHSLSTSGFAALSELDENGDGVIDINDSQFNSLQVWVDANHDGSSENELHSLEELGITSISLNHIQTDTVDFDTGTIVTESSVVTFVNGTVREISEHWFQINSADTEEITVTDVENDLTSFGNMHSLSYALENDESGELQTLVDSFKKSDNFIEKRIIARKILYFITGSSDIAVNSRGGSIDARNLHVLETIMGVDSFVGVNGSTTPNSNAASILNQLFADFDRTYFTLLNKVLGEADYLELIEEIPDDNGEIILELISVEEVVDHYISLGKNVNEMMYNIGVYVKTYDSTYGTNYLSSFVSHYPDYAAEIATMVNGNFVVGTDGNDTLNGSSTQDVIWAEGGDDRINTGIGNDIIYGGTGKDTINAGSGDDVVYGDEGDDTIIGDSGNDTIYGGDGNDTITGGDGNDLIYGGDGNDNITGGFGNDTIYGEDGNDILNGGADDDILYGGDGDDSLSGGTGDDTLYGGAGNDTYHINADHGNDTIHDSEGLSTLVFGDELSADDYSLHIDINSGISLVNTETGETIAIPDFINMPEFYDFIFDGESKILGGGDSRQIIEGTDEDDVITGGNGFNIIYGNDGNDIITGGDNLNFIYGGDGDDTITGGNGTNIIRGENGDDVIRDGSGDSYLDGGNGNDTIYGGDGNDVIIGGAGADELHGENGDDVIAGNDGDDVLYGEDGNDTLYADAGNDELHGGNGNDSLFGGDGDDTIYGDAGDDYLEAGNGTDTLYGGTGNDIFVGGEGINYMYGEDGDDTFYGGNALNYMYGGDGDDNFTGGDLVDYIEGGVGNDTMNGGNGNNEMYGGDGDDYIYGGNDDDYIEGGNGDDYLYGGNGMNTIYGGAGNDIIYSGDNGSSLYGGDGDDLIYAGGGADVLDGGAGNDHLQGDHGGDTYIFGVGYDIDTIHASADLNTIVIHGYTANDMHNTREANNDLVINFGDNTGDIIIVQGFFNFNSNRDFNFVFDDGTVLGQYDIQAESAPIYGTDADEWLGLQGNDGGIIHAGAGNDGLNGGNGNDELYGEDGNDTLYGNDGNDILDGGVGNDTLCGGNGTDTYIFAKGYGNDTINEWGSDHSIVKLTDINSDEVTITDQWGSNLVVSINGTEDTLIISNFKWGQATYSFEFADGAIASVNKDTWELEFSKLPDIPETSEDELVQGNADILNELYADDSLTSDILTETDSTVISDISDSVSVNEDSDEVADQTDIQMMILTENMSAFADEDNVFDNSDVLNSTDDMSMMNQLLVGSQVQ
ncbi:MAG: DUF2974 domain-containing protein [Ruminococcus sp.]|nr:DUF2974 domain-containing protein [Ruminococcus sp.]